MLLFCVKKYKMVIYKITNKINGKAYIGQTRRTVAERIKGHLRKKSKIGKAMIDDGINNFDISIIDYADTQNELDELERFWISFYNACETGYNTLKGGTPTKEEFQMLQKIKRVPKSYSNYKNSKKQQERFCNWFKSVTGYGEKKRIYIADSLLLQKYNEYFDDVSAESIDGKLSKAQKKKIIATFKYRCEEVKNILISKKLWW